MGMTAKRTKNGIVYSFTGELQDALEAAQKELDKKVQSQERVFLQWQFDKAKKARDNYEKRISDTGRKGSLRIAVIIVCGGQFAGFGGIIINHRAAAGGKG